MAPDLAPLIRPNGKVYRPRSLRVEVWQNQWVGDEDCGVVVLGTHDLALATRLADDVIASHFDMVATGAQVGWYRDGFSGNGERAWIYDSVRGAAGVMFTADVPPASTERNTP